MNIILGLIVRNWRQNGTVYFGPDEQAAANEWAIQRVRLLGLNVTDASSTVLPARAAPDLNVWFRPTRSGGEARQAYAYDAERREVSYVGDRGGLGVCTLESWHRWMRRARAVRG